MPQGVRPRLTGPCGLPGRRPLLPSKRPMPASLPLTSNRRFSISHGRAFWAMAAIAVTFPAASAVPSPLYSVYQEEWGILIEHLTEVFGIYAVALLASLLVVGALSDHVGRRPVLFVAIAAEALSLVLFLVAGDVYMLALAQRPGPRHRSRPLDPECHPDRPPARARAKAWRRRQRGRSAGRAGPGRTRLWPAGPARPLPDQPRVRDPACSSRWRAPRWPSISLRRPRSSDPVPGHRSGHASACRSACARTCWRSPRS